MLDLPGDDEDYEIIINTGELSNPADMTTTTQRSSQIPHRLHRYTIDDLHQASVYGTMSRKHIPPKRTSMVRNTPASRSVPPGLKVGPSTMSTAYDIPTNTGEVNLANLSQVSPCEYALVPHRTTAGQIVYVAGDVPLLNEGRVLSYNRPPKPKQISRPDVNMYDVPSSHLQNDLNGYGVYFDQGVSVDGPRVGATTSHRPTDQAVVLHPRQGATQSHTPTDQTVVLHPCVYNGEASYLDMSVQDEPQIYRASSVMRNSGNEQFVNVPFQYSEV